MLRKRLKILFILFLCLYSSNVWGGDKHVAIKTNLLYLAGILPDFEYYTPVPNVEVEWYISDRWSIAGTGAYAKWGTGKGREFGISSWTIEPRFRMDGVWIIEHFYTGVYGMAGDFDKKGYAADPLYNNKTGAYWGGGFSLGCFVPFHRHWGIEIGLRAGIRSTETDLYCDRNPDYYRDDTYTKNRFNLQGLKLAVVYRFAFK